MKYSDLRHFLRSLEAEGDLVRVAEPVSTRLEMTAVGDFTLRRNGPALLFENPVGYTIPVLANLFGTTARVAKAMGATGGERAARHRSRAGQPQGAGAAQGAAGRRSAVTDGEDAVDDAARHRVAPGVSRSRGAGRRDRPRAPAGADLLARRRRPADHLGPGRHARTPRRPGRSPASEPGHLSSAGDRPPSGDHALARPSRRRPRFPRVRRGPPGPAVPDRGRARRGPGDDARRRHAGARHAVGVPVRRLAARQPDRSHRLRGRRCRGRAAGARERRVRVRRPHPGRRRRASPRPASTACRRARSAATCTRSRARSAITPATTTSPTGSRCSRSSG